MLPEEKKAIETRGTDSVDAYNLYLMARQYSVTGNLGDRGRSEALIRLCRRAVQLDPNYARAWALIALTQTNMRFYLGGQGDSGLEATDRALALDGELADAHAAKAVYLVHMRDFDGASAEIAVALRLDPESYEVQRAAGRVSYAKRDLPATIEHLEKAAALMPTDYWSCGMLVGTYHAAGDETRRQRVAHEVIARTEKIIVQDPTNGSAMGFAISALIALKETARAKDLIARAILLDPENQNMRYNMACGVIDLGDIDGALDLLEPLFESLSVELVNWSKTDADLDPIREHPRFKEMVKRAEDRLAALS